MDYSVQAPVPSIDDVVLATSMSPMMSPENMCCSLPSPLHEFFEPIEQKQVRVMINKSTPNLLYFEFELNKQLLNCHGHNCNSMTMLGLECQLCILAIGKNYSIIRSQKL